MGKHTGKVISFNHHAKRLVIVHCDIFLSTPHSRPSYSSQEFDKIVQKKFENKWLLRSRR